MSIYVLFVPPIDEWTYETGLLIHALYCTYLDEMSRLKYLTVKSAHLTFSSTRLKNSLHTHKTDELRVWG